MSWQQNGEKLLHDKRSQYECIQTVGVKQLTVGACKNKCFAFDVIARAGGHCLQ